MATLDQRRSHRFAPPRPLRARFLAQGQTVDAEVVSVGPGGFGAWTEDRFAFLFDPGTHLRELVFDDPLLPAPPPDASIAFSTLRGQSAREGFIMFGAEYQASDPGFLQAMAELMEKLGVTANEVVQPGDGGLTTEGRMGPVVIVEVEPGVERLVSFI